MKLIYLKYIVEGWINLLLDKISDIKYKKEFEDRLNICNKCLNNRRGICDICSCVVAAKTKSEDSRCPKGKWLSIKETLKK